MTLSSGSLILTEQFAPFGWNGSLDKKGDEPSPIRTWRRTHMFIFIDEVIVVII